jgi:type II secretory pathway pseudopilin PulG
MTVSLENRLLVRRISGILLLVALLSVIVIYHFTYRSTDQKERERAQVMLRRLYDLEMAYRSERGTYLRIDRETNGELLRLDSGAGKYTYRVEVAGDAFAAIAEADLDGDGQSEIWRVDQDGPDPVRVQGD